LPKSNRRIFVSIAAYRDPELVPTVRDLLEKATAPGELSVAVLNQDEMPLELSAFPTHQRLILDNCHYAEARGVGWARARVQNHYDGEALYFQLDAHHRFAPGWDDSLRKQLAQLPSERPLLSAYLPAYWHDGAEVKFAPPLAGPMVFAGFNHDGMHLTRSHPHTEDPGLEPLSGSYVSGHFIFTAGEFVTRVPYDPDFYFTGEEQSLALRAFTHGFDVFNPINCFAWHHYGRGDARRHWNDHTGDGLPTRWTDEQGRSLRKWSRLFGLEPHIDPRDGLGTVRTLEDFEAWTGVNAHWQISHPRALAWAQPPVANAHDWTLTEKLLTERTLQIPLPPLSNVETRPAESVEITIRDATPRDAFIRRVSAAEYEALCRNGLQATVRYKQAPLTLTVAARVAGSDGKKYEEVISD
jgi:hypothetical protein